jgi:2,3-bisphosphoglycerate-independent phosphoglycerate mutase
MKYLILIMDGAADFPVPELNNKTPLQVAKKENIDYLTKIGSTGLLNTVPDGCSPDSTTANLSILGYNPKRHNIGRGVIEAYARGIEIKDDEIAFRCNLITVENNKIKSYSAGYISDEEAEQLIEYLNEKIGNEKVKFYKGVGFRNILILKGNFSLDIKCYPPHDYSGYNIDEVKVKPISEKGKETAEFLNDLIYQSNKYLEFHPVNIKREKEGKEKANFIWPWSPGRKPKIEKFYNRYKIKGCVISAVDLIKGIGKMIGFEIINVPGATGLWDTNYEGKAEYAIKALEKFDLVYLHVEGIDEAGHEGNIELKIKCIEDFDRRLVENIIKKVNLNSTKIAILPDHYTPVKLKSHKEGYIPFLIYSPSDEPDRVEKFDEESCKNGKFGKIEGDEFINIFLKGEKCI